MKKINVFMVFLLIMGLAMISRAEMPGPNNAITDVPGIEVGHYTGLEYSSANGAATGTTVILARQGAVAGVSQRGGQPVDLLAFWHGPMPDGCGRGHRLEGLGGPATHCFECETSE